MNRLKGTIPDYPNCVYPVLVLYRNPNRWQTLTMWYHYRLTKKYNNNTLFSYKHGVMHLLLLFFYTFNSDDMLYSKVNDMFYSKHLVGVLKTWPNLEHRPRFTGTTQVSCWRVHVLCIHSLQKASLARHLSPCRHTTRGNGCGHPAEDTFGPHLRSPPLLHLTGLPLYPFHLPTTLPARSLSSPIHARLCPTLVLTYIHHHGLTHCRFPHPGEPHRHPHCTLVAPPRVIAAHRRHL